MVVDSALNRRSAELNLVLADAEHGEFDWLWVLHPVDSVAPTNLTVQGADAYARPGINTFSGYVNDPSGVRSITLDIDGRMVECPVAAAFDSAWTCAVELGALTDATNVRIRARATDMSGNQSAFTPVQTLPVDLAPPTVALGAEIGQFLTDGLIGPAEMNWQGTVQDNRVAAALDICTGPTDMTRCSTIPVVPGDTAQATWNTSLSTLLAGDGVTMTVALYGKDGAGNRGVTPLTRTFMVDTVAPTVTATLQSRTLSGTVGDGGGLRALRVFITAPDSIVRSETLATTPGNDGRLRWTFTPSTTTAGTYSVYVLAEDMSGNTGGTGPFVIHLDAEPPTVTATATSTTTSVPTSTTTSVPTTIVTNTTTATETATMTSTTTSTPTTTPTKVPTATATSTAISTATATMTRTATATNTSTPMATRTPMVTSTASATTTATPVRYEIYLPLVSNGTRATFVATVMEQPIRERPATKGEVFLTGSLTMPTLAQHGGTFYLSSDATGLVPARVDDRIVLKVDGTEVFSHTFGQPINNALRADKPNIVVADSVVIPSGLIAQLSGKRVTMELSDMYGTYVSSSPLYIVWLDQ